MASVEKRKNGYKITVSLGLDVHGKQIKKSKVWKPAPGMKDRQIEEALNREAVLFEEACRNGQILKGDIKFCDFLETWIQDYARPNLKPTTMKNINYMKKRTNQAIGHLKLSQIQPRHLEAFYNNLVEGNIRDNVTLAPVEDFRGLMKGAGLTQKKISEISGISEGTLRQMYNQRNVSKETAEKLCKALKKDLWDLFQRPKAIKPLSPKTVKEYHQFISSVLSTAVRWEVIPANPCEKARTPKAQPTEARFLEKEDAIKLLKLLEDVDITHRTMIILLLFTGIRRGELCGLEWQDIDWERGIIQIRRNSQYTPEMGVYTSTLKTKKSRRDIHVGKMELGLLKQYQKAQLEERISKGDQWVDSGRLFTKWNGEPIHPESVSEWFRRFMKNSGLPYITVHQCRHTSSTIMLAGGVPITTVSKRLGHSRTSTTLDIYSHALKEMDEVASETLAFMLSEKSSRQAE